jgi:hypothetical protein
MPNVPIYPTRPNACVAMQAGEEQCEQARIEMGLQKLKLAFRTVHMHAVEPSER